ncbi:MAG: hypothetical protein AB1567_00445 [bacterium]
MNNGLLAEQEGMGSIYRCCHGGIHVNWMGVTLHFKEDSFLDFALMVKNASSQLMKENIDDFIKNLES